MAFTAGEPGTHGDAVRDRAAQAAAAEWGAQVDDATLARLRACPHCDALLVLPKVDLRAKAGCGRCGAVLMAPSADAFTRIIALALTSMILMAAAVFMPFLDLSAAGMHSRASVLDAALAFSDGMMRPLALAVMVLIVVFPATRLGLILYTLLPLVAGRAPFAHAAPAFRLAEWLKPWSMAEIFMIGVAVALVKVAGLAQVTPGPAFWAFGGLVFVNVLSDSFMDREMIWRAIETRRRHEARRGRRNGGAAGEAAQGGAEGAAPEGAAP